MTHIDTYQAKRIQQCIKLLIPYFCSGKELTIHVTYDKDYWGNQWIKALPDRRSRAAAVAAATAAAEEIVCEYSRGARIGIDVQVGKQFNALSEIQQL